MSNGTRDVRSYDRSSDLWNLVRAAPGSWGQYLQLCDLLLCAFPHLALGLFSALLRRQLLLQLLDL